MEAIPDAPWVCGPYNGPAQPEKKGRAPMAASTRQNTSDQGARSRYRPTPTAPNRQAHQPALSTATTQEERQWPPDSPSGPPQEQPTPPPHPEDAGGPPSGDPLAGLPHVLKVREAAAILRVGRNQLYEAVARGELPAIRIGRTIRIPTTALRDLVAAPAPQSGRTASSR
jgi:excisionase family DNA binding protein